MKNLWLLIALVTIVSCSPKKKVDYAIITGKIENAKSKKLIIYSQYTMDKVSEIRLTEDGSFTDTLKTPTNFYAMRNDKNFTDFYISKGSDLKIEYNTKNQDSTLKFSGSESVINQYLFNKIKNVSNLNINASKLYSKNENDFKTHVLNVKKSEEDFLSKITNIHQDFKENELKNIHYNYLRKLNNYPTYYVRYTKDKDFIISENFLDELKNIDIENEEDFLFSTSYRNIVNSKIREKANNLVKKDSISRDIAFLKTVSETKNQLIKNNLLYESAKYGITYTEDLEEFYTLFSNNSTNEENNKKITEAYNKLKALAKGSPSPKFVDYENNAGGTTSLDDLKGKYLYLDIWATWCGPCIAEIPSLKKLEKKYHGKNIEFVSISIDKTKDHDKWKKMVVDKELKGIQLFADNNWKSKFVEEYLIKGIPRFILIDPQGNIINANAPRPSDEKLVETLKSLEL